MDAEHYSDIKLCYATIYYIHTIWVEGFDNLAFLLLKWFCCSIPLRTIVSLSSSDYAEVLTTDLHHVLVQILWKVDAKTGLDM